MVVLRLERVSSTGSTDRPAGRVVYRTRRGRAHFMVIADFRADGSWDFAESEDDEPRWHAFRPSEEEFDSARQFLTSV